MGTRAIDDEEDKLKTERREKIGSRANMKLFKKTKKRNVKNGVLTHVNIIKTVAGMRKISFIAMKRRMFI